MLEISTLDLQNGTLHMFKDFALPKTGLKHPLSDANAITTTCYLASYNPIEYALNTSLNFLFPPDALGGSLPIEYAEYSGHIEEQRLH